ncbi:glycoside hydrolase family 13 protein [Anaerotalea alkaliphila]|uniref:Glycoside hydrolase family 13 protein n=1 Tax=Anaerotalea alkaliphila TaxID=2662126 RepID=A0A7X5HTT9_9FIRM|nr:glycoside hydrolase family 13 protein [Anaerotalea alkaliphila]NDL66430.1 glycoside hydrolase family 13 protein [Anaerotalea alkaliphila]
MSIHIPFESLSRAHKLFAYVQTRQPILDERAIFSDETKNYKIPQEPTANDQTKVRIRTAKDNIDEVYLCYEDQRIQLYVESEDQLFDYYSGTIPPTRKKVEYHFELLVGRLRCYYNKKGVTREPDPYYNFKVVPGFYTPEWAKGAVMYQIFVDRFHNGDKRNDVVDNEYFYINDTVKRVRDWSKLPDADGVKEFYGGDLQGVMDKLDYLQELGVNVIYLNPIFVSPSNHKYDTQDYEHVDPHFGVIRKDDSRVLDPKDPDNLKAWKYIARTTRKENLEASNALFARLVEQAHKRRIKVILDGVFNHCGSFNKWLDREKFYEKAHSYAPGAYTSEKSPYRSFFHFQKKDAWPDNAHYDGWWGYDTLPKLNYEGSPKLTEKILEIGAKWVSPPYNADGWRLDVAADLGYTKEFNHQFWRKFRKAVRAANPNALILAEHYGDPTDWLADGDQWDTVMNYDAFMEPVTWFLTGMEKHSDEFRGDLLGNHWAFFEAMKHNMARFHASSLQVAMNELSNHDHSRFLTRTNHMVGRTHTVGPEMAEKNLNKGIMKEAVMIQMTWVGAPTIYYGDEAGLCGWTDPDNRRTYPWGKEDTELLALHKALISIRNAMPVLKTGSLKFLYGEHMVLSYGRFDDQQVVVVAVNNAREERTIRVPVWELGILNSDILQQILETTVESHTTESKNYVVEGGRVTLKMKPFSGVMLRKKAYKH